MQPAHYAGLERIRADLQFRRMTRLEKDRAIRLLSEILRYEGIDLDGQQKASGEKGSDVSV